MESYFAVDDQGKIVRHHGILGQKWGQRNGPPYPLSGGAMSAAEKRHIGPKHRRENSLYNKKHYDKMITTNDTLATLSYDKNRTKDTDMFYAAYKKLDKHQYNALFNRKIEGPIYDDDGTEIGTGSYYKYRINNKVKNNVKVASEDSGADAFIELYTSNRDFSNFVRDPNRMQSLFVNEKYKFKGYREAASALERIRSKDVADERDLRTAYRMMNYVIPSDGSGDARKGKDIKTQRARLFNQLSKNGYGAMLDTNDAIYGGFKATAPVIVFNMENVVLADVARVTAQDKRISELAWAGRKVLGK